MELNQSVALETFPGLCSEILSQLSLDDLRSALFLLLDYYRCKETLEYRAKLYCDVVHSRGDLQRCVRDICICNPHLLQEVLGTMRNYKLLKKLGSCKHRYTPDTSAIKQFWRSLFIICEELDDSELQSLKNIFPESNSAVCTEHLICILLFHREIALDEISRLSAALETIGKEEVCLKLNGAGADIKMIDYYIPNPTRSNPCGIAIIINEENFQDCDDRICLKKREGSHFDRDKLKDLWNHFGMQVKSYNEDLTSNRIVSVFEEFVKTVPDYCHVFIACLLSHGDKDVIYGSDSKPVKIDALINLVANCCPFLNNKPKVFVVQACQGQKQQTGAAVSVIPNNVPAVAYETDAVPIAKVPEYGDVFQAIASVPGYVSYRSPVIGSPFITEFTKLVKQYGHVEDIEATMKRVKKALCENSQYIQMPITKSTLRKNLIFKPTVL